MGDGHRLQKLLMSEEYTELEDHVLLEGSFIELDKRGDPVKQVILGLTRDSFLVAKDVITDYRKFPSVKYDADVDLDINDLEMEWIIPVCYLDIQRVPNEHVLNVLSHNGRHRYYMMSNIGGNEKKQWSDWMERVKYIKEDPYGYIKQLYNQWNSNFELFDLEDNKKEKSNTNIIEQEKSTGNLTVDYHSRRRTRVKSLVPEDWHQVLGIQTTSSGRDITKSEEIDKNGDKSENLQENNFKLKKKNKKNLRFNLPQKKGRKKLCSCLS